MTNPLHPALVPANGLAARALNGREGLRGGNGRRYSNAPVAS